VALCCDHYRVFNLLVGRLFLKRFALAYQRPLSVCPVLSVCGIGVLWPNGWMDQNATCYGGRWGPSFPPPVKRSQHSPLFVPCLLWPNSWMDQDATCYGGRPRPRPHCYMGPSSPKGAQQLFGPYLLWPNGWMDQDAAWYGCRPRPRQHCVRWGLGTQLPSHKRGTTAPTFRPMSIVAKE